MSSSVEFVRGAATTALIPFVGAFIAFALSTGQVRVVAGVILVGIVQAAFALFATALLD